MTLGGPALYLLGESLFAWRMTGTPNATRVVVAGILILLALVGGHVSALVLGSTVAAVLAALALWELLPRESRSSVRAMDRGAACRSV